MEYRIVSKRLDRQSKKYIFTLQIAEDLYIDRHAEDISSDKNILYALKGEDIFDIAFTQGCESISEEMKLLKELKKNS